MQGKKFFFIGVFFIGSTVALYYKGHPGLAFITSFIAVLSFIKQRSGK